jgi:ATP-binding cassette subfamily D (ALD) long-chain fatty acid import protein
MYEHAKSIGITLITISLRPSLIKYHTHLLTLNNDAQKSWTLTRVSEAEERMELDREIIELERKLAEVGKLKTRLGELDRLLGASTEVKEDEEEREKEEQEE